jgi:hypothetical protein
MLRAFVAQNGPPDRFVRQAGRASLHWTVSLAFGQTLLTPNNIPVSVAESTLQAEPIAQSLRRYFESK